MEETPEKKTKKAELKTTDLKVEGKKVKVMFLKGSVHEGEIREIDKPLADELAKKRKVTIIKK